MGTVRALTKGVFCRAAACQTALDGDKIDQIVYMYDVAAGKNALAAGHHGLIDEGAVCNGVNRNISCRAQLILGNEADRQKQGITGYILEGLRDGTSLFVHLCNHDTLDALASAHLDNRVRQAQRNAEIVQTLHDIALEAARIRHDLEHHLDFCAFQRHAARHDESDITRAQNNDFFARHIALDIDKALRRAGGVDARRTGAADADCTAAALTATHCKHNRARLNGQNAVLAVDCGDDAILRDAQHHGITLVLDTQLVDLCMEACGILRAGQLLAEDVQTEACVDALL